MASADSLSTSLYQVIFIHSYPSILHVPTAASSTILLVVPTARRLTILAGMMQMMHHNPKQYDRSHHLEDQPLLFVEFPPHGVRPFQFPLGSFGVVSRIRCVGFNDINGFLLLIDKGGQIALDFADLRHALVDVGNFVVPFGQQCGVEVGVLGGVLHQIGLGVGMDVGLAVIGVEIDLLLFVTVTFSIIVVTQL